MKKYEYLKLESNNAEIIDILIFFF